MSPHLTEAERAAEIVAAITRDLRAGYGADDIAIRHGISSAIVRHAIRNMRSRGVFRRPGFFAPIGGQP